MTHVPKAVLRIRDASFMKRKGLDESHVIVILVAIHSFPNTEQSSELICELVPISVKIVDCWNSVLWYQ